MRLIVKNPSTSDTLSYCSNRVTVAVSSEADISPYEWFALYSDDSFLRDLKLGNIIISDGIKDYKFTEAEAYVKLAASDFNYNNKDVDGALIVRMKAAKKGWTFWAMPVEITTSTISGSLFCQLSDGTDIPWITCKIYDANNQEITTPGLANINLSSCVKTVVDFEPTFDYEIIGGALRVNATPTQDVRMWVVGAPDIPANLGGSKEFASGVNLKFLTQDSSFDIDGRVSKYLVYNPATHQSKMRVIFKHTAGLQLNMQLVIHLYRQ